MCGDRGGVECVTCDGRRGRPLAARCAVGGAVRLRVWRGVRRKRRALRTPLCMHVWHLLSTYVSAASGRSAEPEVACVAASRARAPARAPACCVWLCSRLLGPGRPATSIFCSRDLRPRPSMLHVSPLILGSSHPPRAADPSGAPSTLEASSRACGLAPQRGRRARNTGQSEGN